jgi:GAF domain-containing protein
VSCCRTALAGDGPEVLRLVAFPAGPRFAYEHALVRARRAAEKAEARIRVLHHLASGIAAARKPEEVVQSLVQVLSQDCAASAATVWLVDEEERELRRAAGTRPPTALAPEVVRTTTTAGLVAAAARTGQVVVVESPEDCARSHPEVAAALSDARMQAALAVPLVQDGVLLGAYCLSFARPRPVGEEDVELHRMIARNTAQVLQVALLHAKLEHLALHDPLTGLANRSLLFDRLEQALIRATGGGRAWPSCCSTWTASSWSTTASGTPPGTRCSSRWPGG